MYDPKVGRWLSEDPLGFDAGDGNLYRYIANDPTNATDPSGQILNSSTARRQWLAGFVGIIERSLDLEIASGIEPIKHQVQ